MQLAVVEFCRNVIGLSDAQSREFSSTAEHIVVELMDEQRQVTDKGGTMRLGARDTILHEDAWTKQGEASIASLVYRGAAAVRESEQLDILSFIVPIGVIGSVCLCVVAAELVTKKARRRFQTLSTKLGASGVARL